jgi:glycerophosphoryl diester phosphodiesterase
MAITHPFLEASRPLVFAHRGGSLLAPENTLAAFDRGLSLGADGLEFDVHLARDGRVVVCHDATVDRTTDGTGAVVDYSVADLARLDAGYRFCRDGGFPFRNRGFGVPALQDVLARYRDARLIIELKGGTPALAVAALTEVRQADALGRVCFGSVWPSGLRTIRALEPRAATSAARPDVGGALVRSWVGWPMPRGRYLAFQVPERSGVLRVVSPRFVRAAHRAGLPVHVWTVDRAEQMRRLLSWGVDAIITDRPDVAVAVVREVTREEERR